MSRVDKPVAKAASSADDSQHQQKDNLDVVELLLDLAHFVVHLSALQWLYPWF